MSLIRFIKWTIVLFLSVTSMASELDLEIPEPLFPLMAHEDQFYLEMMKHPDSELQVIGLSYWSYAFDQRKHDESILDYFADTLDNLIKLENPSAQVLFLLSDVCENIKVDIKCDLDGITAKQVRLHPQDATVYLLPLKLAVEQNNEGDIFHLIKQMSESTSMGIQVQYKKKFYAVLENFILKNPLTKEVMAFHINDYIAYHHSRIPPTDSEFKTIKEAMPNYLMTLNVIAAEMGVPFPNLRPLVEACSEFEELKFACLNTAKIMFETSQSNVGQSVALTIAKKVHENFGIPEKAVLAEQKINRFKAIIHCLNKSVWVPEIADESYLFFKQAFDVRTAKGELAGDHHYAHLIYQQALAEGGEDIEKLNPELCYEGVDDLYFEDAFGIGLDL